MRTTHTYAVLKIPALAYRVIRGRLEEAGYSEQFINRERDDDITEVIDMHGIALQSESCEHDPSNVIADVMEGEAGGFSLQWCSCCGAIRKVNPLGKGEWKEPVQ